MAALRRKGPFPADAIVRCVAGPGAVQIDKEVVFFTPGAKFRGRDEIVKANPQMFREDIETDGDLRIARAAYHFETYGGVAAETLDIEPVPIERRLEDVDAVVPKAGLPGIPEGKKLAKDDERVKANRDAFVLVAGKNLVASECYRALATMRHVDSNDVEHVVYAGQWVRRDDPMVELHPLQFGLIEP